MLKSCSINRVKLLYDLLLPPRSPFQRFNSSHDMKHVRTTWMFHLLSYMFFSFLAVIYQRLTNLMSICQVTSSDICQNDIILLHTRMDSIHTVTDSTMGG